MTFDPVADAQRKNAELATLLDEHVRDYGFLVVGLGLGKKTHAAVKTHRGHSGYNHPRPLCSPNTRQAYAHACGNQDVEVTCEKCIASLYAKGLL